MHLFGRGPVSGMLVRIAVILFALEALIMIGLAGWHINQKVVVEGLLDSTLLTFLSTPIIYWWVVKSFVVSTETAQQALGRELREKADQARKLEDALLQKTYLLAQNEALRLSLQRANEDVANSNEHLLRRIGADLHDGPAQLLSYVMVRIDAVSRSISDPTLQEQQRKNLRNIKDAVADTLREVRHISEGLAPPNIDGASLLGTLDVVASAHEQHTGTQVERLFDFAGADASPALKLCLYRFAQEALSNSYQHAGGVGQCLSCRSQSQSGRSLLVVTVSDSGPGFCPVEGARHGLGLAGMRSRIEAIGGRFEIDSGPKSGGSTLRAVFDLGRQVVAAS